MNDYCYSCSTETPDGTDKDPQMVLGKFVHIWTHVDVDIWVQRHLDLCDRVASWSKDPSTKCGCFLTNKLHQPLGYGFNGFARGFKDKPERWTNRDFKYRHVIHAEENAILNSFSSLKDSIAYTTHFPCTGCMSKLAQKEVACVWTWKPSRDFLSRWSIDESLAVAMECGIEVNFVDPPII